MSFDRRNKEGRPIQLLPDCASAIPESRVPTLGLHNLPGSSQYGKECKVPECVIGSPGYGGEVATTEHHLHSLGKDTANRCESVCDSGFCPSSGLDSGTGSLFSADQELYKGIQTLQITDSGVAHGNQLENTKTVEEELSDDDDDAYESVGDIDSQVLKIFQQDEEGDSKLHMAIIHSAEAHALSFIELAADYTYLNLANNLSQTPLHLAVLTEQPTTVRKLLVWGGILDVRDRNGNTPLHLACRQGSANCVLALTQPIGHQEALTLPWAVLPQRVPQYQDIKNYEGETCLHQAATCDNLSIVQYLVQKCGADINAPEGKSGRTILHQAVEAHKVDFLCRLIQNNPTINLNARTYDGSTAFQLAMGRGYADVAEFLAMAGADASPSGSGGAVDRESSEMDDSMDTMFDDFSIGGQPIDFAVGKQ